jgi:phenylacetate-CoA ligase
MADKNLIITEGTLMDSSKGTLQSDSTQHDVNYNNIEISVVAPCLNEEGNIPELTRRVFQLFQDRKISGELVLVDDGSTDRTYEVAAALSTKYPNLRIERHATNQGIEIGWRTGVSAACGRYVCLIDADLQNPPENIWDLYQEIIRSGADLVQGSRSSKGRAKDHRFLLSRGLNLILNTTFKMRLRDNKSGFVLASKGVLSEILQHRFKYFYFQSFIAVSAASKGYAISEVDTPFRDRFAGKSFISGLPTKFIYRCLVDVAKGFFEFRVLTARRR